METPQPNQGDLLQQIFRTLQLVQHDYQKLSVAVQNIQGRLDLSPEPRNSTQSLTGSNQHTPNVKRHFEKHGEDSVTASPAIGPTASPSLLSLDGKRETLANGKPASPKRSAASGPSSRIILTTYPGQSGIDPIAMNWGHPDPTIRGPVIVSRSQSTIRRRNGTRLRMVLLAPFETGSDSSFI